MRTLAYGQRVKVVTAEHARGGAPITLNALGTVARVRTDGGAWVTLDKRSHEPVHPFDADDSRGAFVLTYPEACEPATAKSAATRKERRRNEKIASEPQTVTVDMFGKDHWSTFGYAASVCINHGGRPAFERMRCNARRHPMLATIDQREFNRLSHHAEYPTRLKGGEKLIDHDDWDCVDDLIATGFLMNVGTTINPQWKMTDLGLETWKQLSAHEQDGGSFAAFTPSLEKATG